MRWRESWGLCERGSEERRGRRRKSKKRGREREREDRVLGGRERAF